MCCLLSGVFWLADEMALAMLHFAVECFQHCTRHWVMTMMIVIMHCSEVGKTCVRHYRVKQICSQGGLH